MASIVRAGWNLAKTGAKYVAQSIQEEKKEEIPPPCLFYYLAPYAFSIHGSKINIQSKTITIDSPLEYSGISRTITNIAGREDITKFVPSYIHRLMQYFPPPDLKPLIDKLHNKNLPSADVQQGAPQVIVIEHLDYTKIIRYLQDSPTAVLWYTILRTIRFLQQHYAFPYDSDISLTDKDLKEDFSPVGMKHWKAENLKKIQDQNDKDCAMALHKTVCLIKQGFFDHDNLKEQLPKDPLNDISSKIKEIFENKLQLLAQQCKELLEVSESHFTNDENRMKETVIKRIQETGDQLRDQCYMILKSKQQEHEKSMQIA